MAVDDDPLRFVAPMRRHLVRSRIRMIEEFMKGPGGQEEAYVSSKALGLTISSFYRLVKAWRDTKDPTLLGVARARKQRDPSIRHRVSDEQKLAIKDAAAGSGPSETRERVVYRAMAIMTERGVRIPSVMVLRQLVDEIAPRSKPTGTVLPDGRGTLIVDHVALAIGVMFPGMSTAIQPIASLLVAPETRSIVGFILRPDEPGPKAVAALLEHSLLTGRVAAHEGADIQSLRPLEIDSGDGHEWRALLDALKAGGCEVVGFEEGSTRRDPWAFRFFGPELAGVRLKPRLTTTPAVNRSWKPKSARDVALSAGETAAMLSDRLSLDGPGAGEPLLISNQSPDDFVLAVGAV